MKFINNTDNKALMKNIVYVLAIILFHSCSITRNATMSNHDTGYKIKKIEKNKDWYIIYAEREYTLYKIVSYSYPEDKTTEDCKKIKVGRSYAFELISRKEGLPDDLKQYVPSFRTCYTFYNDTQICIEPENFIYDLFLTDDLRGLCYIKKSK